MDSAKQRQNAKKFIKEWKGYEKGETQKFWISLLQDVLGIPQAVRLLDFEKQVVVDGQTKFIDAYIKPTKILIEQKGASIDLNKKYKQSGGAMLTPFEQAKRYAADLGKNLYPNYIVVCNFKEFQIHDMSDPNAEPVIIKLEDLPTQVYRLAFLADVEKEVTAFEQKISVEAGEIVGEIYDALLAQYANPNNPDSLKSLNKLCVRLVFCLYAEDSGLFSTHLEFHDYLRKYSADARTALIQLFKVLNTPEDKRDPYLADDLLAFPYVNGGLFADEDIEIPKITPTIVELILKKASEGFDWSLISPTIFGAVFESTLNPETRRKGGMHYTSVENIHKVIDPLFLDELKDELKNALELKVPGTRKKRLEAFRKKLGTLIFLDPACGSGNFLTETYKCLRELENEALRETYQGQMALGEDLSPIEVHIKQFYGIEINDFAVTVAKTALWIAESQMMKETEDIVGQDLDFLPLKSSAHIHEGNALQLDWKDIVPVSQLNYIMGNPPFVGYKLQTKQQKEDLEKVDPTLSSAIDYVAGWFIKAAKLISSEKRDISCAFVATNSIAQGEQVLNVWRPILKGLNLSIRFAYQTFKWTSDSLDAAAVHVVIIGFGKPEPAKKKKLFLDNNSSLVNNINGYLVDAPDLFVEKSSLPISGEEPMIYGSEPREGGNLILSQEEKDEIIKECNETERLIKRFVSADDFLNNRVRYCLWIENEDLGTALKSNLIKKRLASCKTFREQSKQKQAHESSKTPYRFTSPRQPKTTYLLIPIVSSENRRYIPVGYVSKDIITSNANFTISNASLYTLGVLTSSIHMAWMRTVAGRLKSDYRYSNTIVYNNFIWPKVTEKNKSQIEKTAQMILDARAKHPTMSLAQLYDELTMPEDLRNAHTANDKAVMKAYGFKPSMTEPEIVAELFKLYEVKLKELEQEEKKKEEKSKATEKSRSGKAN